MPARKDLAIKVKTLSVTHPELSRSDIARKVGCTPGNVTTVLKAFVGNVTEQDLQDFQNNRSQILDALLVQIVKSITPKKLEKSSAAQLTTMLGIIIDKLQLLNGQPTSINVMAIWDLAAAMRDRQG